jgi:ABC-type branched-subunit amino acid transport system ATPase component
MDSRVGVLGANGAGKSTLLNLITVILQPFQGTVSNHAALTLAQSSQRSTDQLPYDKSPIEYFQSLFYEKYLENEAMALRQQLGRFGLSGAHQTRETGKQSSLSDDTRLTDVQSGIRAARDGTSSYYSYAHTSTGGQHLFNKLNDPAYPQPIPVQDVPAPPTLPVACRPNDSM